MVKLAHFVECEKVCEELIWPNVTTKAPHRRTGFIMATSVRAVIAESSVAQQCPLVAHSNTPNLLIKATFQLKRSLQREKKHVFNMSLLCESKLLKLALKSFFHRSVLTEKYLNSFHLAMTCLIVELHIKIKYNVPAQFRF